MCCPGGCHWACVCVNTHRATRLRFFMCVVLILYSVRFAILDRDISLDICCSRILSQIYIQYLTELHMQSDSLDRCHTFCRARLSQGCHEVSGWTWLVNPLWTKIGNGGRCNHAVTENDADFQGSVEICLKLILTLKVTVMWSEKTPSLLDR